MKQVKEPGGLTIPICVVSDRNNQQDYQQFGFNELNLKVSLARGLPYMHYVYIRCFCRGLALHLATSQPQQGTANMF